MRWPWEGMPWGRSRGSDAGDAPAGDAAPPTRPTSRTPGEGASSDTGLPAAWTRVPPLQRSVSDGTAVAPPAAFRSSLTTHRNPSFLAPLGHLVDPDGPAGVVGGLASSVGGPIPYGATDELRVPDRPAPTPDPGVQRTMAMLRPTVTSEQGAPSPDSSGPEFLPETPPVPETGSRPDPAPLSVPVQRADASTAATTSGFRGSIADATPLTSRPVVTPPGAGDGPRSVHSATETAPRPSTPETSAAGDLVVARSVVGPSTGSERAASGGVDSGPTKPLVTETASPSGNEVAGLVADRPPLPSSPLDGTDPSPYASDHPAPLTVASASGSGSAPAIQRSGPTAPALSRLPTGLDEQGYPPLVARSVQRSAMDHPPTTGATSASDSGPPAQAPLSPFSAVISALRDPPEEPVDDRGAISEDLGTTRVPDLVVARRVMPDAGGQLPPADVHLQRDGQSSGHPRLGRDPVQRSLITGRSPLPPSRTAPPTAAAIPAAPAVQRIRYEGAPSSDRRQVDPQSGFTDLAGPGQVELPIGPDAASTSLAPVHEASWSAAAAGPPSSAGVSWSVQRRRADSARTIGLPPGAPVRDLPAAAPFSPPVALEAVSAAPAALGIPAVPVGPTPHSTSTSPSPTAHPDGLPLVQRRDAPARSTAGSAPLAPPAEADRPAMAVSSRSVGLAEMFALAAAQSTDGVTVQRSAEAEVQPTSLDSGPDAPSASSATSSAAPAGPPAPAPPLSGAELEEMARRLYEPLSARLRTELWQDRERSGLLTDLRP